MRWQFGSSINPSKELAIFGDMLPTEKIGNSMLYRRVVNFDDEASGYAAWYLDGVAADGNILTYILPKKKLPDPVLPSSQIYENGGAFSGIKKTAHSDCTRFCTTLNHKTSGTHTMRSMDFHSQGWVIAY